MPGAYEEETIRSNVDVPHYKKQKEELAKFSEQS